MTTLLTVAGTVLGFAVLLAALAWADADERRHEDEGQSDA